MANNLRDKASATYSEAKAKAADAVSKGRTKAEDAARTAKDRAERATAATKASAKRAAEKTTETVDHNPIAAIVGGLAVGAIVAALLPRSRREDALVGEMGKKVRSTASNAAKNATATAKEQLDALGVNADAARDQIRDLVGKVAEAAKSAGSAAADTVRTK
jgi:ElaB/YqjD/DUF883 family membrane-anchored ribosome-binding protein